MHLGIDYGAKTAGTTAICFEIEGELQVHMSRKKSNADKFIETFIHDLSPSRIFIDAPLSLPGAFTGLNSNYSHRNCDKALNAMSPMFLGGLTARAIELKDKFEMQGIKFYEAYPKALMQHLELSFHYKKDISLFTIQLEKVSDKYKFPKVASWHEVDAMLCWLTGRRFLTNEVEMVGDVEEGIILY